MNKKTWVIAGTALLCSLSVNAIYSFERSKLVEDYAVPKIVEPLLNKVNKYRVELGKTLFFDPRLSGSNWISCATCHNPAMGWSDGLPTGIGEGQNMLGRATPTILNTAFNHLQMWDGRFKSLEEQALAPVESKDEMNQDLDELVAELQAISGYIDMFNDAYPGRGITKETIGLAIANFERTIVSSTAPFDRWVSGNDEAISAQAKRGFKLFEGKGNCSTCHSGYKFSDDGFHNIGLKKQDDLGRFKIKPVKVTKGAFKTPTLRDVVKTAPYMHNGAYRTLDEVVEHYIKGGENKSNLSPNFKKAKLNATEKQDLIAFLHTLTSDPVEITYPQMPN